MDTSTMLVNRKISIHPTKPDLKDASRHAYKWRSLSDLNIKNISELTTQWCWSGIEWFQGHRLSENFVRADWGALDFDGSYPLEQACRDWCDTTSIIMTTKSDTPACRRFRVMFLFERTITEMSQYKANIDALVAKYDSDPQANCGARMFWPGKQIVQVTESGFLQPVLNVFEKEHGKMELQARRKYMLMGTKDIFPRNIFRLLKGEGEIDGNRNNLCHKVSKYLYWYGLSEEKIIELICKSELPLKNPYSLKEAEHAARSGIKRAKRINENAKNSTRSVVPGIGDDDETREPGPKTSAPGNLPRGRTGAGEMPGTSGTPGPGGSLC